MKALIIDNNIGFIEDISRTLLIDEREDVDVLTESNIDNMFSDVQSFKPDVVVIAARLCGSVDDDIDIPVRTYAKNAKEIETARENGFECYGIVSRTSNLLDIISEDETIFQPIKKKALEKPSTVLSEPIKKEVKPIATPVIEEEKVEIAEEIEKPIPKAPLKTNPIKDQLERKRKVVTFEEEADDSFSQIGFGRRTLVNTSQPVQKKTQKVDPVKAVSIEKSKRKATSLFDEEDDDIVIESFEPKMTPIKEETKVIEEKEEVKVETVKKTEEAREDISFIKKVESVSLDEKEEESPKVIKKKTDDVVLKETKSASTAVDDVKPLATTKKKVVVDMEDIPLEDYVQEEPREGFEYGHYEKLGRSILSKSGERLPLYIYKYIENGEEKSIYCVYDIKNNQYYRYNNSPLLEPPTKVAAPLDMSLDDDRFDVKEETSKSKGAEKEKPTKKEDRYSVSKQISRRNTKEIDMEGQTSILARQEFEREFGSGRREKKKAECIAVYSAKGGVGKTTISCELATCLALTEYKRSKYKVCIADFNIDFGDVMNTLYFDQKGATMTTWAEDIQDRLNSGEEIEDIQYTEDQISKWLQRKDDGLYGLLAPISNIDSMEISSEAISVMINNLLNNCGFDYVICDTGNNTRDASFIAIEKADKVLLVLTQTVNAANCNNSFMQTAERVGFDMSKIKLIINKVKPTKAVGIDPRELEGSFRNSKTDVPYKFETYAWIQYDDGVINAGNEGKPLVYNPSHPFTKSIREIVKHLNGEKYALSVPKKKGLFQKIFSK